MAKAGTVSGAFNRYNQTKTMQTKPSMNRRTFLQRTGLAAAGVAAASLTGCESIGLRRGPLYKISLAEWSLHRAIRDRGTMNNLDFPVVARQAYGIDAVEYVNQFFIDKAKDTAYLRELKLRSDGEGVTNLLIMCDREGNLGDLNDGQRQLAVENHFKWADAAKFLGCHSIRVNAATGNTGTYLDQQNRAADGLRKLSEFAAPLGLNVLVENHGGLSSNGEWLAGVMRLVHLPNCGTLPDFGNFTVRPGENYDRYKGVAEMMPYAKAVSAKSHEFDERGDEIHTDYLKMVGIVVEAGYHGYMGIEYEGSRLSEPEGIRATKRLLEKVRDELS